MGYYCPYAVSADPSTDTFFMKSGDISWLLLKLLCLPGYIMYKLYNQEKFPVPVRGFSISVQVVRKWLDMVEEPGGAPAPPGSTCSQTKTEVFINIFFSLILFMDKSS